MKTNNKAIFAYYLSQFKNYKFVLFLNLFGSTLGILGGLSWSLVFKQFIEKLSWDAPRELIAEALFISLLLLMLVELIEFIGWRISSYTKNYLLAETMNNIMNHCFKVIHQQSYAFFSNNYSGALVKKAHRLVSSFSSAYENIGKELYTMFLKTVLIIGYLFYLHPILGSIFLAWAIFFLIFNYFLSIYKLKFDLERSKSDSLVSGQLADNITNATNVKLFANFKFEKLKFKQVTDLWYKNSKKSWDVTAHIDSFQNLLIIFLQFAIFYFTIQLWVDQKITAADFFIVQAYVIDTIYSLWNFGRVFRDIYEDLADSDEMIQIINKPLEIVDAPNAKNLKVPHGKIEFQNINFSYNQNRTVIKDFNLDIKPSEKIAIIGSSGGGKSTIIKLLLRLFEVDSGQILIDGQDISKVTQDSLHKQVSLVPQDPILFHRSLFENIQYGNPKATKQEVIAASKLAYCHEFIKNLPHQYDTLVGERGIKLSGGERQRIAIARAILANSPILILDEATSSLDSESEHIIQKALENLMKNKTAIIIAHRLSTIQKSDRIIVIQKGKIIEEGSHNQIIKNKSGTYNKLWNLQVGKTKPI